MNLSRIGGYAVREVARHPGLPRTGISAASAGPFHSRNSQEHVAWSARTSPPLQRRVRRSKTGRESDWKGLGVGSRFELIIDSLSWCGTSQTWPETLG